MLVQVAKDRFLPAAKSVIGERHGDRHVDPDHADVDARCKVTRGVAVTGKDRRAVAHFVIHRKAKRLFIGFGADGRQNRPEDLVLVDVHIGGDVVKEVRADKEAFLVALQLKVAPVDNQRGPLIDAGLHQPFDVCLCGCGDHGAVIDVIARGIWPDFQLLDARHQLFDQTVGGFLAHRHSDRDRHAAFARRAIARADQRVRGLVQIGVRHDDHVVLRTAKALDAFAIRAARAVDIFGDGGGADKADRLNDRVMQDRVNRFLVAIDDLNDTFGQARFFQQFGQHQGHGWITLGRFEDEGVAADDGGGEHPHGDHGGEVERRDTCGHAKGLAHGIHVDAGARAVGEIAFQQLGRADAVFHHFQTALHVTGGIGQGLAVFAAQRFGEFVHIAVQQVHELHHHPRPTLGVHRGPCGLRGHGVFHGLIQLCLASQRHLGLHFAGCGVVHVGKAA